MALVHEAAQPTQPRSERKHGRSRAHVPGDALAHDPWGHVEPGLVAEPAEPQDSPPELQPVQSHGRGVQLRGGVQEARPRGREAGPHRADDGQPGLVAGGFRPLRRAPHPHGVAQRRHVPHRRRARRRRRRPAALRAAQQLAGQREPRQGAPAAVADQAEIRRQDLLGRPDDPRRQRRARIDGLQDLRLRRRARGRLGARGRRLLGRRENLARATSATRATGSSRTRSPPCRWV